MAVVKQNRIIKQTKYRTLILRLKLQLQKSEALVRELMANTHPQAYTHPQVYTHIRAPFCIIVQPFTHTHDY